MRANQHNMDRGLSLRLFGGVALAIALGFGGGLLFLHRYVAFTVEQQDHHAVVLVSTPIGTFPRLGRANDLPTLWEAVYPNSKWDEQGNFVTYSGDRGAAKKKGQLTVLRFETDDTEKMVMDWYRRRLGPEFVRAMGWPTMAGYEEWRRAVAVVIQPNSGVYEQQQPSRVRGVIVSNDSPRGAAITLYEWRSEKRP